MKRSLLGFGAILILLLAACASEQGGSEAPLVSTSAEEPGNAKNKVGAAVESDGGGAPSSAPAPAAKASTFTMAKSCADADAGACAFTANITAERDDQVFQDCLTMLARADGCEVLDITADATGTICDAFAKSMKPEVATTFECQASHICDDGGSGCTAPPPTTLGDQLCAAVTSACENDEVWFDCTADGRATWNGLGGELRTDAANAALSCTTYTCGDMRSCLDAWQTAIGFAPATP